jgi:hypothetical protein
LVALRSIILALLHALLASLTIIVTSLHAMLE